MHLLVQSARQLPRSLFAQHLKQFVDVVCALPCVLVTDRANFLKDGVFLHGSIDINSAGVAITGQRKPISEQHFSIRLIVKRLLMCLQFHVSKKSVHPQIVCIEQKTGNQAASRRRRGNQTNRTNH